jgi:hypothetical protein
MTYAQLLDQLYRMPKDRLEDTVTVYDPQRDDFCGVITTGTSGDQNDVLDPGHFFLVINTL